MSGAEQTIVVGVTGRGENTDALRYAAREARMTGRTVTLVHAALPVVPSIPPAMPVDGAWSETGAAIAEDVRQEFEELTDHGVPVRTSVLRGEPGWVLGELTADASLVVLQHRDLSRLHRLITGSTVASAAAHVHCPLVSVPPAYDETEHGLVVAGLHEDGGPREVVEVAFRETDRRGRALRLVHAWHLMPGYDDILVSDARWRTDVETALRATARELTEKYPDVPVEVSLLHEWPVEAMVTLSKQADLLVLGRHGAHRVVPPRLGSLTRTVVQHAASPVMVVPV